MGSRLPLQPYLSSRLKLTPSLTIRTLNACRLRLLIAGLLLWVGTNAWAGRVLVSTSQPVGEIPRTLVTMLGNRLQKIAIGKADLLSPRVLRPLEMEGLASTDPDDCASARCDRVLKEHFHTLHLLYEASDLLLLQIVREQQTTQLRLKRVRVDQPMITTALGTELCVACETPELLARLVPLFQQVWKTEQPEVPAVAVPEETPKAPEATAEKDATATQQDALVDEQPAPEEAQTPVVSETPEKPATDSVEEPVAESDEAAAPESQTDDWAKEFQEELEQGATELPLAEELSEEEYEEELRPEAESDSLEKLFEQPTPDPYDVAAQAYNQYLMTKLQDVSYALQVYQTGMKVLVELEIGVNGELLNQRLLKTSGLEDFDQLALEQLEFMQFSPLPEPMVVFAPHVVHVFLQNSSR